MTLILGMSKAEGVYLSVDYRVTRPGKPSDDASVKFLTVLYPPDKTGPRAVLAYTGLAELRDGTPMGSWIRETLRGESEDVNQSMAHLLARLNRDIAPLRQALMVNVLGVQEGRRYFGGFSNVRMGSNDSLVTKKEFTYSIRESVQPELFANGLGAVTALADRHLERVRSQLAVTPRKPLDHMKLLAAVNR